MCTELLPSNYKDEGIYEVRCSDGLRCHDILYQVSETLSDAFESLWRTYKGTNSNVIE
jgi:hypothetical protein